MRHPSCLFAAAGFALLVGASAAFAAEVPAELGFNKFDLPAQYLGYASGGRGKEGWVRTTRAMAEKALADAQYFRAAFLRVAITGYAPSAAGERGDLDLWLNQPDLYWKTIDGMMADVERHEIKLVPVFVWNVNQFPAMAGETVADLIARPRSHSRALLRRYVEEFIARYRARDLFAFYELTNELNLGADLDQVRRCRDQRGETQLCRTRANYTTDEMNEFTLWLAAVIRAVDSARLISSGFSVPRGIASRLRARPEWITGALPREPDTPQELERYLIDVHRPLDIVSVHIYPRGENRRFGGDEEALLERLNAIAQSAGKRLYLGEFGDDNPDKDRPGNFVERMLAAVERLTVPLASPWIFEFYQAKPYPVAGSKAYSFNLEPGYTPRTLSSFREFSCRLSRERCRAAPPETRPRVVLAWPMPCTPLTYPIEAFAVASENAAASSAVSFGVDERVLAIVDKPPYRARLTPDAASRVRRVFARACNSIGCSEDSVSFNGSPAECQATN